MVRGMIPRFRRGRSVIVLSTSASILCKADTSIYVSVVARDDSVTSSALSS